MIALKKIDRNGNLIFLSDGFTEIESRGKTIQLNCDDGGILIVVTDDTDLIKSRKIFRKVALASLKIHDTLFDDFKNKLAANSHSLKPIVGQLKQEIGKIVPNALIKDINNYSELKESVISNLTKNTENAADVVIYLKKRIVELSHHMLGFELVSMGANLRINKVSQNIKDIILNITHAFDDEFKENGLTLHLYADDAECNSNKLLLDYKTIDLAFYNILHNANKYCLVGSTIKINITIKENLLNISIQMTSKRIEKDEVETIFNKGVRGRNSQNDEGSGMGLFISKLALNANYLDLFVLPDHSISQLYDNERYDLNTFYIVENRH